MLLVNTLRTFVAVPKFTLKNELSTDQNRKYTKNSTSTDKIDKDINFFLLTLNDGGDNIFRINVIDQYYKNVCNCS